MNSRQRRQYVRKMKPVVLEKLMLIRLTGSPAQQQMALQMATDLKNPSLRLNATKITLLAE